MPLSSASMMQQLTAIFSDSGISTTSEDKNIYGSDLTHHSNINPFCIVFPENEKQLIALVKLANAKKIGLVPSGGRTGYSGAAVAKNHEIVVSFEKMNKVIEISTQDQQITCEAGTTLQSIQKAAQKNTLYYPIDYAPSATEKAQIGGNIATNAGGVGVLRYGMTRKQVIGLRVVTGKGDLLELNNGLMKNNTGYDLSQIFIGSEGTLGFITQATLQLTVPPKPTKILLLSIYDNKHLIRLLKQFRQQLTVHAFEFFSGLALEYTLKVSHLPAPFKEPSPFYAILEYEKESSDCVVNTILAQAKKQKMIHSYIMTGQEKEKIRLWRYRKEISMSLLPHAPYKYDISVKPSKTANFIIEADSALKECHPNLNVIWFGHIGDGNMHLNLIKPKDLDQNQFTTLLRKTDGIISKMLQRYQGSVSAEHGIGLLKRELLPFTRSKKELEYMRSIKQLFDPNSIMNPGKIFSAKIS